jgi:HTH-type transcriptional regulator/antitoxin HigA
MLRSTNTVAGTIPKTYAELLKLHLPRPINDDADLDNANEIVERLAVLKHPTRDQRDYLEVLTTLVEKYEDEHHEIDVSHLAPVDRLKFLLESNDMNASDLGRLLGQRELGPKILNGTRELSKSHIRKLVQRFQVSADTFL